MKLGFTLMIIGAIGILVGGGWAVVEWFATAIGGVIFGDSMHG